MQVSNWYPKRGFTQGARARVDFVVHVYAGCYLKREIDQIILENVNICLYFLK